MGIKEVFTIVQFTMPMYTALICGLLFSRMYYKDESPLGRKNIKWVVGANALSVFVWFSMTLYLAMPKAFVLLNPLILTSAMLVHILYYRFIFEITRVGEDEKFPVLHYLVPAIGFVLMLVASFLTPFDRQLHVVTSQGEWTEESKFYAILSTSKISLYFLFDIIYALLGLRRTMRFRKVVINYSADEQRTSMVWLYQFLIIMLVALPMIAGTLFLPIQILITSGIVLLPMAITMAKDIILAHNVLLENYVIIKSDSSFLDKKTIQDILSEPIAENDISKLEAYIRKKKPYLNSRLKITDMTADLNTNRTSLSLLINRNYGMNFSRFINRYRLGELANIKINPANIELDEFELVAKAGFSDYRGYKRVRQREEIDIELLQFKTLKNES